MTSSQITMWNYHTKRTWTRFLLKKYLVKLAQDEYIWMLLQNWSQPIMIGFACLCCNFLELIFPLSPSILSNILPASSEETKQKSVVTIEKTSNFQKWSKQNWDLITDFLIHIWGWYWWLHMQKLLLSSLLKFFSKFQQNVMSILLLCKKIQTFFCNYFSMCTLFWIDLQKTQKKLLIYVLFIPIFDFWYFGPFSCVIFFPLFSILAILPCKM